MAIATLEANLKDTGSTPEGVRGFEQLYDGLEQKPDFMFLAEAYDEARGLDPGLAVFAQAHGMNLYHAPYNDAEENKARHGWVALAAAKLVVGQETTLYMGTQEERARYAGRTALMLHMRDEESGQVVTMVGAHLSDRSAALNAAQAASLLEQLDPDEPTALVLQTNSMRSWGVRPAVLRLAGRALSGAPQAEPGDPTPASILSAEGLDWLRARIASLAVRLGGMAAGGSYRQLREAGFRSDNPLWQWATVHVGPRFFQLPVGKVDHIWTRNAAVRSHRPLKNILTPTTKGLRRVPHRVTIGEVYIPTERAA